MSKVFASDTQTGTINHQNVIQRKKRNDNIIKKRGKYGNNYHPIQDSLESPNKMVLKVSNKTNNSWYPKTQLGNLVLSGKIRNFEDIFLQNMQIAEEEIVDHLLGISNLKEKIFGIKPVITKRLAQKAFKVIVVIGDYNGHIGIGIKTSPEIANAIRDAKKIAKLSIVPVIRGSWQSNDRTLHTVSTPIIGCYEDIEMRLMPAPKGTGIVACSIAKKLLEMCGFKDVYASSTGHAKSTFDYLIATYKAIQYTFLSRQNCKSKKNIKSMVLLINAPGIQKALPCQNIIASQENCRLTTEIIQ